MGWHNGNWSPDNRFRIRVKSTRTSRTATHDRVRMQVYLQTRYYAHDANGVDAWSSGFWSHSHVSVTFNHGGSMQQTHLFTVTKNVPRSYGSSTHKSSNFRVKDVAAYSGSSVVTVGHTAPARAWSKPLAPTWFKVKTPWNASKATLQWNGRTQSSGRKRTSWTIHRDHVRPDGSRVGYSHLATVGRGARSYTDTSLGDGTRYYYRIRANGPGGSSGWQHFGTAPYVTTKPKKPTNLDAKRASGDVELSWDWSQGFHGGTITFDIDRQDSPSGSWATVKSGLSNGARSWTDTNPNAGYNRYRIRAVMGPYGSTTLRSGWATSNTVSTIVPPDPPTDVMFTEDVPDFSDDQTLTWDYHDGGDGHDQTHYTIDYSTDEGDNWVTLVSDVSSGDSAHTIDAGTLDNDTSYMFRVKTQADTSKGFSGWSDPYTVTGYTVPTASISEPGATVDQIPFTIEWDYQQDEGKSQIEYELEIWALDSGSLDDRVERHTVQSSDDSRSIDTVLDDGETYRIRLRVQSSVGQWSDWFTHEFTVSLLAPTPAHCDLYYDAGSGTVAVTVESDEALAEDINLAPNPSFEEQGDSFTVFTNRVINPMGLDDGSSWDVDTGSVEYMLHDEEDGLKITPSGGAVDVGALVDNPESNRITGRFRVRSLSSSAEGTAMKAEVLDDTQSYSEQASFTMPSGDEFLDIDLSYAHHTASDDVWMRVWSDESLDAGWEGFISQPIVIPTDTGVVPVPYFDGDTGIGDDDVSPEWDDEPDNSISYLKAHTVAGNVPDTVSSTFWSADGARSQRIWNTVGSAALNRLLIQDSGLTGSVSDDTMTVLATFHIPDDFNDSGGGNTMVFEVFDGVASLGHETIPSTPGDHTIRLKIDMTGVTSFAIRVIGSDAIGDSVYVDKFAVVDGDFDGDWEDTFATAPVERFDLERRINHGDWVTIAENIDFDESTTLLDTVPTLRGVNEYRMKLYSVAPSVAYSGYCEQLVNRTNNEQWLFLSYGEAFTTILRMKCSPDVDVKPSRSGTTQPLHGRRWPIMLEGDQRSKTIDVNGVIKYSDACHPETFPNSEGEQDGAPSWQELGYASPPREWEDARYDSRVIAYRDPYGNRVFGRLSGMDWSPIRDTLDIADLQFTVEQIDYSERPLTLPVVEGE